MEITEIVCGDAYKLIQQVPDRSIDLIVTDPPYLISTAKKKKSSSGLTADINNLCNQLENSNVVNGINLEILDEFVRVMKRINIYIWCNKHQIKDYLNFFVGKHKCAFDILVWIKTNPIPLFGSNYLNDKEFCLYFRKGIKLQTTYESGKTYWITKTNVADKKLYHHPTIKPQWIIEQLITNSSKEGDTVLDCFSGSGTTAAAAVKTCRNYLCFELDEKYVEISRTRVSMATNYIDSPL